MKTRMFTLFLALTVTFGASISAHANEFFNSSLSGPGVYWGTGNQNSGFDVLTATNSADGSTLQLGLSAITRYVGPITPTTNDYFYSPSAGPLANWNFAFSVNTGTDALSAYTYNLIIADDTTHKTVSFDPTWLPDNGQANSSGVVCKGCAMDMSNNGFQNSENLGFMFLRSSLGFDANAADIYTITLSAIPTDGNAVDPSVSINVIPTSATPEPSSLVLLGTGILGFAGAVRKYIIR